MYPKLRCQVQSWLDSELVGSRIQAPNYQASCPSLLGISSGLPGVRPTQHG